MEQMEQEVHSSSEGMISRRHPISNRDRKAYAEFDKLLPDEQQNVAQLWRKDTSQEEMLALLSYDGDDRATQVARMLAQAFALNFLDNKLTLLTQQPTYIDHGDNSTSGEGPFAFKVIGEHSSEPTQEEKDAILGRLRPAQEELEKKGIKTRVVQVETSICEATAYSYRLRIEDVKPQDTPDLIETFAKNLPKPVQEDLKREVLGAPEKGRGRS